MRVIVPGIPKAQPRVRPSGRGHGVWMPETASAWRAAVAAAVRAHPAFPAEPWTGPVRVDLFLLFPRPKRLMRKRDRNGPMWHFVKPDRDNCDKAVLDALGVAKRLRRGAVAGLRKAGLFRDDCQVCDGRIVKLYCEKRGEPRAVIVAEQITWEPDGVPMEGDNGD